MVLRALALTEASEFVSGDSPKPTVQELLGHATITITLDTYSHVLPGIGGGAADAIGEALRRRYCCQVSVCQ